MEWEAKMTSTIRVSEKVRQQFVGRTEALDAFYLRFAYRHMKNGIYYCGGGGLGKTWILQKIIFDNQADPIRVVTNIVDFFNTQNHSVRGLQTTIRSYLQALEAFRSYDEVIKRLEEAKAKRETHPSAIASLQARANRVFIQCCQEAIIGREVILLFDTFERVQQRHVGQWLLQEFLPQVGDLIVVIAGRPEPAPARMPDNVVLHKLPGLTLEAVAELVRRRLPSAPDDMVESIWKHTDGIPLIVNLVLDLPEPQRGRFISELGRLEDEKRVQDSPELQRGLVRQFSDPADRRNRVIWAMAYLRRRFDVPMLRYVVEDLEKWFRPADYDEIFEELGQSIYVKEFPHQQSHLLHDEIQRMVAEYVLAEVTDPWKEFRADLYDLVVNHNYPEAIEATENPPLDERTPADIDLARQLRAERLGYILDEDPYAGLKRYESYRSEIEETYNYDFEELLWGEVREHLDHFEGRGYQICFDRGQWLRRHSLFHKAEEHYRQMLDLFEDRRIEISQSVGFMAMRQGKIPQAKAIFEKSLEWIREDEFEAIAMVEGNLAQAAIEAGEWDKALDYYARSFRAASLAHDDARKTAVYLGRGYLYSLQGMYSYAKKQSELALEFLGSLPDNSTNAQRIIYAWMNLGTAYRYSSDCASAKSCYEKGLKLAQEIQHREAICDSLQHIGINAHLWGRTFRRKQENLTEACERQLQAWRHLVEALEMARESDWRRAIANGLHRLAHVYREIHRLQQLSIETETPDFTEALRTLQREARTYQTSFEIEFEYELLMSGPFADLNWLERAARLFEISALVADEANDFHRALDDLTELARLFLELGHFDLVPLILGRIERIKGYDYEEPLFAQLSQIIEGDWHFEQKRYDEALQRYGASYAKLAKLTGYASYQLDNNLRNLEWRFSILPCEMVLPWCDALEDAWLAQSVSTVRPDMLDMLERIRLNALTQFKNE